MSGFLFVSCGIFFFNPYFIDFSETKYILLFLLNCLRALRRCNIYTDHQSGNNGLCLLECSQAATAIAGGWQWVKQSLKVGWGEVGQRGGEQVEEEMSKICCHP